MRLKIPVVLTAAVLAVPLFGVAAAPAASATPASARTAGTYSNPLDLQLPGGQTAASCADPFVLRPTAGDHRWTLYCTADALTSSETDSSGALVIHQVPQYRSTDLVHWTYAGDAFPTKPSWLKPDAGVWAPDVVYRNGQYRMYYTASDTNAGGSAIGLATSPSPTGPWTDTGTAVVPPGVNPDNGQVRWEFDPEVDLRERPRLPLLRVVTTAASSYGSCRPTAAPRSPRPRSGSRSTTATRAPTSSSATAGTTSSARRRTAATAR